MKGNEIKNALDKISIDNSTKTRILNKIQINENQDKTKEGIFTMIKNSTLKYVSGAVVGALALGGVFITTNNNIEQIDSKDVSRTSVQTQEKLAIVGEIKEITNKDQGYLVTVVGAKKDGSIYDNVSVYAHASTNIFEDNKDELLDSSDLKVGQKVKVYYDGTEIENSPGEISGLRIIIEKN